MASLQGSITTVSGRRCTRSRARTAATSTLISTPTAAPTAAAPTEPTTSTVAEQTTQIQPTAANPSASQPPPPPPPPPAPPISSSPVEQPAVVPVPTSQAAVTSSVGTGNAVLISLATSSPPAVVEPSASASALPTSSALPLSSGPVVASSQVATAPTLPPARIAPTSSDTVETAVTESSSPPTTTPPAAQSAVIESTGVVGSTSVAAVPDLIQTTSISQTFVATSIVGLRPQTSSALISSPTRGPVGVIAPEQGSHSGADGHSSGSGHSGQGHSSHGSSEPNIKGIVGGVIGGFVGLALLGVLLFFCLKRCKSREAEWVEKSEHSSGYISKVKAVPASFGAFFARLRNEKTGPLDNPYQRHHSRSSVGSVYSTASNGRARSVSEPQGGGFIRRMSSRKSERNVLRKKTSSVSSQLPFTRVVEEPIRSNNFGDSPFAGSTPDTPRNLRISNPDKTEQQTREADLPQPVAIPRVARDPFASLIDEIDGAPGWLQDSQMTASLVSNHRRMQSTASELQSELSSSVYSTNPSTDPSRVPVLTQSSTQRPQPPLNTYSAFPAIRDSNYTFFGEPGPSRPGTNVFNSGLPTNSGASRPGTNTFSNAAIIPAFPTSGLPTSTSRMDRQSDPFDLDRPEVLSFKGIMNQMRDSIVRQTSTRSRQTSIVGNWFGRDGSPSGALNGPGVQR